MGRGSNCITCRIHPFSLINSDFLNISNLLFSTNDFLFIAIAAIPMTFVIVTGGIDVSIGSIMGLTSILIGVLWMNGIPILFAVIIALIISCLAGALNGLIIKMTDVEPLVVTLGTMFLYGELPSSFQEGQVLLGTKE